MPNELTLKDIQVHSRPTDVTSEFSERAARMFIEDDIADAKYDFFEGREIPSDEGSNVRKTDEVTITITSRTGNNTKVQTMELYRDENGVETTAIRECLVVANDRESGKKLYDQLARSPAMDFIGATEAAVAFAAHGKKEND